MPLNSDHWYDVVTGSSLMQGDLLCQCPVAHVPGIRTATEDNQSNFEIQIRKIDLIVLSQSCDIQENKVDNIVTAHVTSYDDLHASADRANRPEIKSKNFRKQLVNGLHPAFFLLSSHQGDPPHPWSLVDFRKLEVVPLEDLRNHAEGASPRLRLRSPYREFLSQSLARFFMRVGLPYVPSEFVTYEPDRE